MRVLHEDGLVWRQHNLVFGDVVKHELLQEGALFLVEGRPVLRNYLDVVALKVGQSLFGQRGFALLR